MWLDIALYETQGHACLEVELPYTQLSVPPRQLPFGISESQPQLNELQHVHVHLQGLVVVIPAALEVPYRPVDKV